MALIERQQQQEQQQQRLAQKRRQGPEGDPCRLAKKPAGEEREKARGGCVTDTALLCSTVGFELKSLGSGSPRTRHRRPLFDNFVPEKQKKEREREGGRQEKERNLAVIVCVLTWSKK